MRNSKFKTTAKFYQEYDPNLADLYDESEESKSKEDEVSLYPILSRLKSESKDYAEFEEIARGGEKRVIRAYSNKANREVALARPHDDTIEGHERFLREACITAQLEHPNIMPIYQIGLDDLERPFYSMELLRGKSFSELIAQYHAGNNEVSLNDLLEILLKVCDALAYAHSKNILHLDLKPDNVHVGAFGDVLLIDWGLAKILVEDRSVDEELYGAYIPPDCDTLNEMTLAGTLKGTLGFMAPEQSANGDKKSFATEVYSLGALLYYILTHKFHIDGESKEALLNNTRNGNVQPPHLRFPEKNIDVGLNAVCMKSLKLNPRDRYLNVHKFQRDLQAYLRGYATSAEHAGSMKLLLLIYKRNKVRFNIITASLVMIVAGTLFSISAIRNREQLAISEKKTAEIAQKQAEDSLAKYTQAKKDNQKIRNEFVSTIEDFKYNAELSTDLDSFIVQQLVGLVFANNRKFQFDAAMELSEIALKKNPQDPYALAEKGFLLMIYQEFNAAWHTLGKSIKQAPHTFYLYRLAHRFYRVKSKLGLRDDEPLPHKEFMEYVQAIPTGSGDWLKMFLLIRNHQTSSSLTEHSKVVRDYILLKNPSLVTTNFHFDFVENESGNTLSLAGNKELYSLRHFAPNLFQHSSLLATLDLKKLDLSNTSISDIKNLEDTGIEELNLVGTDVKNLSNLILFKESPLKRVRISKNSIKIGLNRVKNMGIEILEE